MSDQVINTENVLGLEIKIHNEREQMLVNIFKARVDDIERYYKDNTFGIDTGKIIERVAVEIQTLSCALFYLSLTEKIIVAHEVLKILKIK